MMNGFYTAVDPDLDVACLALVALSLTAPPKGSDASTK
jgi:hypothetical protein